MNRLIVGMGLISILSGCATKTVPLNPNAGSAYRGKSITYAIHETPDFSAMTAGMATFGGIGGAAMVGKGNKIIRENEVPDPARAIAAVLVNDLATEYGLLVMLPNKKTHAKNPEGIASDYRESDLVLDVQTFNWGFAYFPLDWNNYRILYVCKLKLIDTEKQTVLAVGKFKYDSKDSGVYPSYDQLMNNKAEGLKMELKKAEEKCIADFRKRIF